MSLTIGSTCSSAQAEMSVPTVSKVAPHVAVASSIQAPFVSVVASSTAASVLSRIAMTARRPE